MKDRIIFLDFDGPVNNILFNDMYVGHKGELIATWAGPQDGFVNNYQALCWLNYLYDTYPFDIVVTSSWRETAVDKKAGLELCRKCLYNGGLDKKIDVIDTLDFGINRSALINKWVNINNFKGDYLIIDDDDYYTEEVESRYRPTNCEYMTFRFIKVDSLVGITVTEYNKARDTFEILRQRSYFEDKYYKCTAYRYIDENRLNYSIDYFTCMNPPSKEDIEKNEARYVIGREDKKEFEIIEDIIEYEKHNNFNFIIKTKKVDYIFDLI